MDGWSDLPFALPRFFTEKDDTGNAKGALKTLAAKLTSQDTFLQCRFDAYQQSFDGQRENEDSWRVKSVIVYMKGSLLEDDIRADITIVYFLAVRHGNLVWHRS